jgi:membrane-associated protease RseP (regulator of RpoE activity)
VAVAVVGPNQTKMARAEAQAAVAPVTPLTRPLAYLELELQDKVTTARMGTVMAVLAAAVVAQVLLVLSATAAQVQRLLSPAHRSHALVAVGVGLPVWEERAVAVARATQDRLTLAVVAARRTPSPAAPAL